MINKLLARISPQEKNLDYFKQLTITGHWQKEFIGGKEFWICKEDNMCQIEIGQSGDDFHEPWTEVYPDKDTSWRIPIYLKINNTAIKEITFIACDEDVFLSQCQKLLLKMKTEYFSGKNIR